MTAPDIFALGGRGDGDLRPEVVAKIAEFAHVFVAKLIEMKPDYDFAKSPLASQSDEEILRRLMST
jgi:hypothetical protein